MMQERENYQSRNCADKLNGAIKTDRKQKIQDVMEKVARQCGQIMQSANTNHLSINTKTNYRDVVTKFDKEIQKFATSQILKEFPEAHFVGEEEGLNTFSKTGLNFIIDPIDGTMNFIHNMKYSCTAIGCLENGVPIVAAIYNPYTDEMFTAKKGEGAFLNGKPIHVSDESIKKSFVIFGTAPYNPETFSDTFKKAQAILERCQDLKRLGSCALDLCNIACGRAGMFFEPSIYVWDYAGASLILEEAGGVCMTYEGKPLPFDPSRKHSIIAGTKRVIKESGILDM